ncbi:MAG: glutamine-hydrolyzing carbamoyl-phosphate synthase small subunit [Parvularculaceae bacterium]
MKISQAGPRPSTARIAFADGFVLEGYGFGAEAETVGEVCFNTAVTGYQEILTDPSYAAQIVTFTFPHVGNVGANDEDNENATPASADAARGAIVNRVPTSPSSYRAKYDFAAWMKRRGVVGVAGVDTRELTNRIRENGMPHAAIAYRADGRFDEAALVEKARAFAGLEGKDLARDVTPASAYREDETAWRWPAGHERSQTAGPRVVVIDFGAKRNILRLLAAAGADVHAVPATATIDDVMALSPDGVVLSNGPGDPAATARYARWTIEALLKRDVPLFGVCLGHQLLALSLGAKTVKMRQGHHGANHPVKELATGRVEIVSMNHGFAVDATTLPEGVEPTYVSLFDGTNAGIRLTGARAASVQHHPEASPGPQDSFGVFKAFVDGLRAA